MIKVQLGFYYAFGGYQKVRENMTQHLVDK
jgi:hypothetical protein